MTVSATLLGWAPAGGAILRSTARAGDLLVVCGPVGDGWLGLEAARGRPMDHAGTLAAHYRLPTPWLALRAALRRWARAAADVSDGLLADAGHIASASGLGVDVDLDPLPLSAGGAAWLALQPDRAEALLRLATGGDDYALACAVAPGDLASFIDDVTRAGCPVARVGRFRVEPGRLVALDGRVLTPSQDGWRH
jgi:thiamine-monophosphate kinase